MTEHQLEYQTGLISPKSTNKSETVVPDDSVLSPSILNVLRKLRDHNPSLQRKLSHGIASTDDVHDQSLSYWNRYQQIVMMKEDALIGINLGGLMVRIVDVIPFLQALEAENIALHTINFGGTDVGMDNLYQGMKDLPPAALASWKKLYLGSCGVGSRRGTDDLTNVLKFCSNVETLDLRYNDLQGRDMEQLSQILSLDECKVSILHLEGNMMKCTGATAVGGILAKSTSLKELYLGSNGISAEGAKALATGLNDNACVEKLYLEENFIGDEGANAFSEVLLGQRERQCKVLEKLYFDNNGMNKDAATKLGRALDSEGLIDGSLFDSAP